MQIPSPFFSINNNWNFINSMKFPSSFNGRNSICVCVCSLKMKKGMGLELEKKGDDDDDSGQVLCRSNSILHNIHACSQILHLIPYNKCHKKFHL